MANVSTRTTRAPKGAATAPEICLATDAPHIRLRLAENVICMFADDRPPVANTNVRRRGRLPRNVLRFRIRPLEPGDIAELCRGALPSNHGRRVRILAYNYQRGGYDIEAVSGYLDVFDVETGELDGQDRTSFANPNNLRRISNWKLKGGAA